MIESIACEKCKCIISCIKDPDTIDVSMVWYHGCDKCKSELKKILGGEIPAPIWAKADKE